MKTKQLLSGLMMCLVLCMGLTACQSKTETREKSEKNPEITQQEEKSLDNADLKDGIPTVIDFYATWCGPCKQIEPVFNELKQKYGDKLNFLRVDVDQQPEIASEYNISAMPTFVFIDADDKEIDRIVGAYSDKLKEVVEKLAENQ